MINNNTTSNQSTITITLSINTTNPNNITSMEQQSLHTHTEHKKYRRKKIRGKAISGLGRGNNRKMTTKSTSPISLLEPLSISVTEQKANTKSNL